MRKSLDETWRYLESQGEEMRRDPNDRPLIPDCMPNHDDEVLRFMYYKYYLEDADNGNLTLQRGFLGRSRFARVSFVGTDLTDSRMCWNEFESCDFSSADLSGCDLRASRFTDCKLVGAILRGADLRCSTFVNCDFARADLSQAVAVDTDFQGCVQDFLTPDQDAQMVLSPDEGPEPPGG